MGKTKVIVGITGFARAGKDTIANEFVARHGFKKFDMSSLLGEELEKRGLPRTKEQMSRLGDVLRKKHGPSVMAD
ncbi:MAG TPA: hypothetical protein VJA40_05415, partial [archaeon]|nr:hypothetical protein [archaeon]